MAHNETPHRTERDSMGEVEVPRDALFGAQTRRALDNFPISDLRKPRRFVQALGAIKLEAANVNHELGLLDEDLRDAIVAAAEEVMAGELDNQFVLDVFQTGSGTSTNMNANEVIANRAIQVLGGELGSKDPVHPNDHVNMGQSSNDVIPTAIHLAALISLQARPLAGAREAARSAGGEGERVRRRRQDGQDAPAGRRPRSGSARSSRATRARWSAAWRASTRPWTSSPRWPSGGTAVGTGINTHPEFARRVTERLSARFGVEVRETENHFQAQSAMDGGRGRERGHKDGRGQPHEDRQRHTLARAAGRAPASGR